MLRLRCIYDRISTVLNITASVLVLLGVLDLHQELMGNMSKCSVILISIIMVLVTLIGCSVSTNADPDVSLTESSLDQTMQQTEFSYVEPAATDAPTELSTEPVTEPPTDPPTEAVDVSIPYEPGKYFLTFTDENTSKSMEYWLFIPNNAVKDMPIVVFLHGDGEVGRPQNLEDYGFIASAKEIYGDDFPCIAISPCTKVKSWASDSITTTLKGLIDHISWECSVSSIAITGHSRGGYGVWKMVSLYGDYFSRAVPVSCTYIGSLNYENLAEVPLMCFAGTVGSFEKKCKEEMGVMAERTVEAGGQAEVVVLDDMDHGLMSTAPYTEEIIQWMISQ